MVNECQNSIKTKVFVGSLKNPKTQYQYQHKWSCNPIHIHAHSPYTSAARTKETQESTSWTYIALISQQYWFQTRSSIDSNFDICSYSNSYGLFLANIINMKIHHHSSDEDELVSLDSSFSSSRCCWDEESWSYMWIGGFFWKTLGSLSILL